MDPPGTSAGPLRGGSEQSSPGASLTPRRATTLNSLVDPSADLEYSSRDP